MSKKIIIAGGTGFVGKYLTGQFRNSGYVVIIISRQQQSIKWSDTEGIISALENSAMLINLAGKSVDCRYNRKNKEEILKSRTETTKALGEAVLKCNNPPELWINSGTATIYRHAEDRPMTESSGEIGSGFSVDVATKWEQAFFSFHLPKTRQVVLRMAIVLGKNGGVMMPLINLVRFGFGGRQGKGNQMFSWIHIEDLFNIILFFQSHKELKGIFNCSTPNPIDNKTLMKTFRKAMNVKIGLPFPELLLRIGAAIIQTEPELILKSRWVVPKRLLQAGYTFKFAAIESALGNILNNEQ
ncbi:MAG: TIGR01777 family oxidoreductase [Ginsengibacter sp.]